MDRRESLDFRRPMSVDRRRACRPPRARCPSPPQHEWLEAVKCWNGGGSAPSGSSSIRCAPASTSCSTAIAVAVPLAAAVSGAARRRAPEQEMDWYRVERPEWYRRRRLGADAGSGWRRRRGSSRVRPVRPIDRLDSGSASFWRQFDDRRPEASTRCSRPRLTVTPRDRVHSRSRRSTPRAPSSSSCRFRPI